LAAESKANEEVGTMNDEVTEIDSSVQRFIDSMKKLIIESMNQ
jgi:hypothetical protein